MSLPKGYGSITKMSGNRRNPYAVTVSGRVDGRPTRKTLSYHPTKEDALLALSMFHQRKLSFDDIDNTKMTFKEVYEFWVKTEGDNLDKGNLGAYRMAFNHCALIESYKFKDITSGHMQYVVDNCGKGYETQKKIKILFKQLSLIAKKYKIADNMDYEFVKIPQRSIESPGKAFGQYDIDKLWDGVADYNCQTILLLIYTGMRINELLDVKLEQIDLENQVILNCGSKTEAGRNRAVPIHNDILPIIKERMKGRTWLVEGATGRVGYTTFSYHFKKRYGSRYRIHDTRHTCITLMDNAGVPDHLQKLIVGHKVEDITKRVFTHTTYAQLVDAINLI